MEGKEKEEEAKKARSDTENMEREERNRKEAKRLKNLEDRLERESKGMEERWKENEERLTIMEERTEREESSRTGKEGREGEGMKNMGSNARKKVDENLHERINKILEGILKDGGKHNEKEDREAHASIDRLKAEMAKDRNDRQDTEWNNKENKEIQDAKESEREMERKLEGAMDQMKILNLDFGRECVDRKTLVKEAISKIKDKLVDTDREEFDRIMEGSRVVILGKSSSLKETEKGRIHTVPILITCGCRNMKDRMEAIARKAAVSTTYQWPKEWMDFVEKI
jgi:hypothetical protein